MATVTITVPDNFDQLLKVKYPSTLYANAQVWAQHQFDLTLFGVTLDAQTMTSLAYQNQTGSVPLGSLDDLLTAGLANGIVQTADQWVANGYVLYAGTTWVLNPSPPPVSNAATSTAIANSASA